MEQFTRSEYISLSMKKRKNQNRFFNWVYILFFISGFISIILLIIVNKFPDAIRIYLLYTSYRNFSILELQNILITTYGNIDLLTIILLFYWGFLVTFVIFLLSFMNIIVKPLKIIFFHNFDRILNRALTHVHSLIININNYQKKPSPAFRKQLLKQINKTHFYRFICPIEKKWYLNQNHQWFRSKAISKETRRIIFTLSNFNKALGIDLQNRSNIDLYIHPIELLESFILSVANRSNNGKFRITDLRNMNEFEILNSFAKSSSPLITRAQTTNQGDIGREPKVLRIINNIIQSPIIKYALSFSSIATIIMLIGVIIFKIEASQAFLTWFTVSFGSISISVILELIQQLRISKTKENTN